MKNERTQYTTRLSSELLERVQKVADETGASTSSALALLVALGLKVYDGKVATQIEEAHSPFHIP